MSYVVFKGTRPAGNKKFSVYETARSHVRKLIRRAIGNFSSVNPSIGDFGYSIRKVA